MAYPDPPAPALDQLLADTEEMVRCESPSSDPDAVARSADVVAGVGTARLGVAPETLAIDGVTHLRWRFGTGPSRVLLLGHHDTVWPVGTLLTHPYGIVDGVMRGPGTVDMKAGLAMMFHAVATLPDPSGIALLVVGDEELGSPTSRALIEAEAAGCAAALVLEAAAHDGSVKIGRKGVSIYTITVVGRAAHAGVEPERGVNATVELAHQVRRVAELADPELGTTVTPTVVSGGTTANTVPGRATFSIDVRALTAAEQQRVDRAIRSLRPVLDGAELIVRGGVNRPPLEEAAAAELFARARRLAERVGLGPLTGTTVGGGSDGNFTAGIGVPTLDGLGPVGGGAHADHEHVLVDELPRRTRLLTALLADLLGNL